MFFFIQGQYAVCGYCLYFKLFVVFLFLRKAYVDKMCPNIHYLDHKLLIINGVLVNAMRIIEVLEAPRLEIIHRPGACKIL